MNLTHAQSYTELQKHRDEIDFLHEKADNAMTLLDYQTALDYCNEALNLALKIEDKAAEAKSYRKTGYLYYKNNDLTKALDYLIKASQIQVVEKLDQELAETRNVLGLVYTEKGEYQQALDYFDNALDLFKREQLFSSQTEIIKNKGAVYLKQGDYALANELFEDAFNRSNKYAMEYVRAELNLLNARALLGLNRTQEAINDCIDAIDIGKDNEYPWIITEGYRTLSKIYEGKGDINNAYAHLKHHNKFRDSIFDVRSERLTKEAIEKFASEARERLIQQQNQEIKFTEEKLRQSHYIAALGAAFLILFLLFILFLYRNNQKRRKANQLLRDTNDQLRVAKEEAEKANKAKAQFLSTVTHELRTPLYAVTGLTDLLLEQNPNQEQAEHLRSLRFSGDYLLNFINDILDVNKMEANKIEIERIPFNLTKLARNVLVTLKKSADDNGSVLHLKMEDDAPKFVHGDSLRISQVLINLVSNAIKFTKHGNVYLIIKKLSQHGDRVKLFFEVKDTGIGIAYDKQEIIFESFSQGSVQINRKYGGTGLGLTIVKNLLQLMESQIQLKSEPGKGTSFFFELEFDIADQSEVEKLDAFSTDTSDYIDILKDKTVLLVEDVKINQLITKKTLAKKNINCIAVDNGTDAVQKAKDEAFDLILMDLHMPGISGIDATKAIRAFDQEIPIIALTAITIDEERQEDFDNAGFNDTLTKPFKSDIFFRKIYQQLKKSG